MLRDKKWVDERSHEAYAKNYSIVFKHDEPLAARGRRKSALHKVRFVGVKNIIRRSNITEIK